MNLLGNKVDWWKWSNVSPFITIWTQKDKKWGVLVSSNKCSVSKRIKLQTLFSPCEVTWNPNFTLRNVELAQTDPSLFRVTANHMPSSSAFWRVYHTSFPEQDELEHQTFLCGSWVIFRKHEERSLISAQEGPSDPTLIALIFWNKMIQWALLRMK